ELREPAEVGEEAPALDREIVRQRGGDDASLFDLDPVGRAVENGVTARERIDVRRDAELARAELVVATFILLVRENVVDDEADRRIELRGEGLVGRGELGLNLLRHVLGNLTLQTLFVGGRRRR